MTRVVFVNPYTSIRPRFLQPHIEVEYAVGNEVGHHGVVPYGERPAGKWVRPIVKNDYDNIVDDSEIEQMKNRGGSEWVQLKAGRREKGRSNKKRSQH